MRVRGVVVAEVALGGQTETFEAFFELGYARLVRSLLALTGRRAVAEEIAQEAMLEAYRRWSSVSAFERPDLWVRRVAINRAISTRRRVVAEMAAFARIGLPPEEARPVELRDEALWAAVRRLSGQQRAAMVLSIEGYTAREIGDVLGCSDETAQTHVRRARTRLATILGEEEA